MYLTNFSLGLLAAKRALDARATGQYDSFCRPYAKPPTNFIAPALDVFVIPSPVVAVFHCTKHISGQLELAGYLIVRVGIHCKLLNELVEIGAIVIVLGFYHNFLCL